MSGTNIQGSPTGSMTMAGGQASIFPIGFGYYPAEGSRCISTQYSWASQLGYFEDLTAAVAMGVETTIQSVIIDNSSNAATVTLLVQGSGQVLTVPGGQQGAFPLLFTGTPQFQITTTATAPTSVTRLYLLNVPINAAGTWGAPTVAAGGVPAIAPGTGAVSVPGGLSLGGATTSPPSYANGTLDALSLETRGALRVALYSGNIQLAPPGSNATGLLIAGSYVPNPVEMSTFQPSGLILDAYNSLMVDTESLTPMYSAGQFASGVVSTTDIFTFFGSATKTIRIRSISLACTALQLVNLQLRNTANVGGSFSVPSSVPADSNNPAATAALAAYSANPTTVGGGPGNLFCFTIGANQPSFVLSFGQTDQALVLRGTSQGIAINMGGNGAAGTWSIGVKWQEV